MVVCMKAGRVFGIHCLLSAWKSLVNDNSSVYIPTLYTFNSEKVNRVELCTDCFMLSPLPRFIAFADLLSLYLITFFMFF